MDELRPPIVIPAGIIRTEQEILEFAAMDTIAVQTIGSFSLHESLGNREGGKKRVFYRDLEKQATYNYIGLENPGIRVASEYLPRSIQAVKDAGPFAVLQVVALKGEDPMTTYPVLVDWALEMGADRVELDISCPNIGSEDLLCNNVDSTLEVLGAVRKVVGMQPHIGIKVSDLPRSTIGRYRDSSDLHIDHVTTINSNSNQLSPTDPMSQHRVIEVNEGRAGMSGPIIRPSAIRNLMDWVGYGPKPSYEVWSVGGLTGGADLYERTHQLGATYAGGAQELYDSNNRQEIIRRWATEYAEAT